MICVECGSDVEHLIGGSCAACFVRATPLLSVPDVVRIELCAHCGARKSGAHWHDPGDAPEEWVRDETVRDSVGVHERVDNPVLETDERQLDERTFHYAIELHGTGDGVPLSESAEAQLRRTKSVCDRCSRLAGGYYAAIIQLRATERDVRPDESERAHRIVATELERQLEGGNRFAFLSKDGSMHGGHDYYIGDIDAARNVSRLLKDRLGASMHESAKLVGRREGEDVYRITFLVRIHAFSPGDLAVGKADHRLFSVVAVHQGGKVAVLDLETHRRDRVHEERLKRLGGPELLQDAVRVSRDASGVQVLDPQSYKTETVLVPVEYDDEGETVPVLRHEERLYWAPRPGGWMS